MLYNNVSFGLPLNFICKAGFSSLQPVGVQPKSLNNTLCLSRHCYREHFINYSGPNLVYNIVVVCKYAYMWLGMSFRFRSTEGLTQILTVRGLQNELTKWPSQACLAIPNQGLLLLSLEVKLLRPPTGLFDITNNQEGILDDVMYKYIAKEGTSYNSYIHSFFHVLYCTVYALFQLNLVIIILAAFN